MEGKYANIIIDIAHEKLDKTFQYKIPEELSGKIYPGAVVEIPFGSGNRVIRGFVMEITNEAEYDTTKMKYILDMINDLEGNTCAESILIRLAAWMKQNYGSTMAASLRVVLPIRKQIKKKEKQYIYLCLTEEEAEKQLAVFEKKHQTARYRLLSELIKEKEIPREMITEKLHVTSAVIKSLLEMGILQVNAKRMYRNPVKEGNVSGLRVTLRPTQQEIADAIISNYRNGNRDTCLIRGVTGSGKTEVYMEIIDAVVKSGKQAIVLIPEIALTYQTVMRFYKRFGDRVSTLHSKLSEGERFDQFERARNGEIDVMIGPRSALFTPFQSLGIIIIDEEHESSYKSEQIPKYHVRETAIERARLSDAMVILGSATPSIDAYDKAKKGIYKLYEMEERAGGGSLANVFVVDLRDELAHGNRSMFSDLLQEKMELCLARGEQMMLFLNRRGYAGFVSCRKCGHVFRCPHCDISLSAHNNGKLVCHYCGYEEKYIRKCPECGSAFVGTMKAGTEQVELAVKKLFPAARVLRMDMDTTRRKDGHEQILSAFANHEADILIGTQMIVKGHDFPNVTLVGVLAADLSLYVNDYRAGERTFQLLTQAAGRAGRGTKCGEVVIQTYNPENESIQAAAKQDYISFYEQEMAYRTLMGYPPAAHMLAVLTEAAIETDAAKWAKLIADIASKEEKVHVIGPAAATVARVKDIYRQMVYIKSESYDMLVKIKDDIEEIERKIMVQNQQEEKNHRITFDFDPVNAY